METLKEERSEEGLKGKEGKKREGEKRIGKKRRIAKENKKKKKCNLERD